MASAALPPIHRPARPAPFDGWLPLALTAALFALLFARPAALLARDWWNNPEAGHGLLLAPLAVWLAWRAGIRPEARPNVVAGAALLAAAVLVRYLSGLAAEIFTMRMSLILAAAALVVYAFGFRQLRAWWLSLALLVLSVPLPEVVLSAVALPLQFMASRMGAALLEARHVPVLLAGNVIRLPNGHDLFVAEACSGLRSLTALLSLAVLLGGMALRHPASRLVLLAIAVPVAILVNGVRVFLTGFLVYFVSPSLGEGFMHTTEGWSLFLVAFAILGALAWLLAFVERRVGGRGRRGAAADAAPLVATVDDHD
ncbi:MAG: exosortase/archaeosortase family protein [Gemmatimonadaceae bacterium]